ncbi:MAG: hypothetical protein H0W96_11130 [Solirubrobacterales bacterium]|nr:hypothetical protein [Solirubrobacterales bacterium]
MITTRVGSAQASFARQVVVRRGARMRVVVTGDSMIFGMYEALGRDLGRRALVHGDAHQGKGISTPGEFRWPDHARNSARRLRPDVTIVLLGAADNGWPFTTAAGESIHCCGPQWSEQYGLRAQSMMRAYMRSGRGLVYWVQVPAPRSAAKAKVFAAANAGVAQVAAPMSHGVSVIDRVADVLAPGGRFQTAITLGGRRRVVRHQDGVHLTAPGIRIAINILTAELRRDGLLP